MELNLLPLLIPMVVGGFFFLALGLPPLWGMVAGVVGVFISNKVAFGSWRTTPWGDLW